MLVVCLRSMTRMASQVSEDICSTCMLLYVSCSLLFLQLLEPTGAQKCVA